MAVSFVALAALYLGVYYTVHEYFSLTQIPVTPWSIALCVLLADLAYYFEHRFSHRVPGRPTPFTTARRISTGHCCQRKNRERSKTRSKVELDLWAGGDGVCPIWCSTSSGSLGATMS